MKKLLFVVAFLLAVALFISPSVGYSQPGRGGYGYGMGPGMMGGWGWVDIPSKLPAPKSEEYVQKLREILTMEKQSLAQYEADQEKFNAYMPYMMVIPQEENHIEWIEMMFKAYERPSDGRVPAVVSTGTLKDAYELAVKFETDLLPRYEWLVKNAGDRDSAQVLNAILFQSRWHMVMFEHAIRMGHGYGFSRGLGRGGWGMMGGYGRGPGMMWGGYGHRYRSTEKPIDMKEAKAMVNDYLKFARNPNLKMGKIKDANRVFEAEIVTKNNSLVDRLLIDKETGFIRSAY